MGIENEFESRVHALLATDPAAQHLGIEVVSASEERTVLRIRPTPEMYNGFGLLHGGYVFMLADTAFAYSLVATGVEAVTHHAHITYMSPIRGDIVEAEARIVDRYGKQVICEVGVHDANGEIKTRVTINGVIVRRPNETNRLSVSR